jgi:predicted aspartyl protease
MVMILISFAVVADLGAFGLQVNDSKLSVNADKIPLQDLLRALSYNGITIRIDPKINPLISAEFSDRDLEEGLKSILKPHNHAFVWKPIPPFPKEADSTYQLKEIHIFRPGEKDLMVDIEPLDEDEQSTRSKLTKDDEQGTKETETEVVIHNDKVYVPVTLAYQGEEVETTLVFDTGASGIVLHQNIAEQLGIEQTSPSKARGVGGIEIETRLARLQYIVVGPHEKKDVKIDIVAYQALPNDPEGLYNGLLGMSFIKGLKYTIDFDKQAIQWHP